MLRELSSPVRLRSSAHVSRYHHFNAAVLSLPQLGLLASPTTLSPSLFAMWPPHQASHNKELLMQRSGGLLRGTFQSIQYAPVARRPRVSCHTNIALPFGVLPFSSIDHSAVYELEGLRGMWRGLGPALSGVIPSRAVQFATYSFMKRTLAPILGENTSLHLVSASVAGAHDTRTHAHNTV